MQPLKLQILQIFTANSNAYLTGDLNEVSDRGQSGKRSCSQVGGERFKPLYGSFFSVKNPVNAVKKLWRLQPKILNYILTKLRLEKSSDLRRNNSNLLMSSTNKGCIERIIVYDFLLQKMSGFKKLTSAMKNLHYSIVIWNTTLRKTFLRSLGFW